jgi:hypothetical protein
MLAMYGKRVKKDALVNKQKVLNTEINFNKQITNAMKYLLK